MNLLLSPHNDDESLFAAYTCIRHKPLVIVCLRSFVAAAWPDGPHYEEREPETKAACDILGCEYQQFELPDKDPPWELLYKKLAGIHPDRVWAPFPEPGGHKHHNAIATIAIALYANVEFYATYTRRGGKTTAGDIVVPTVEEEMIKRRAMACYQTQANHRNTQAAFNTWPIDEYLIRLPNA